jgi:hypothetical protein
VLLVGSEKSGKVQSIGFLVGLSSVSLHEFIGSVIRGSFSVSVLLSIIHPVLGFVISIGTVLGLGDNIVDVTNKFVGGCATASPSA